MKYNFEKVNPKRIFNYDTSSFEYVSQEDVFEQIKESEGFSTDEEVAEVPLIVHGIYINDKGNYGPQPVVALDDCYLSLPQHMLPSCQRILENQSAIDAINAEECCIFISRYTHPRYKRQCYSFKFGNC